jgi:ribosomal protein S18 acetylase RimI-like enzyme
MLIRKSKESEVSDIARYQVLMAQESEGMELDYETVFRGVSMVFQDSGKGFYLTAEDDGRMIACLMITLEWSDWRAKTVYWIQSLYVEPAYRRKGVFRSMYNFLKEEIAKRDDVAGIRLYVDLGNTRAIKAYEGIGMNGEHYKLFEDIES